jgi:hypothetical protein
MQGITNQAILDYKIIVKAGTTGPKNSNVKNLLHLEPLTLFKLPAYTLPHQ